MNRRLRPAVAEKSGNDGINPTEQLKRDGFTFDCGAVSKIRKKFDVSYLVMNKKHKIKTQKSNIKKIFDFFRLLLIYYLLFDIMLLL